MIAGVTTSVGETSALRVAAGARGAVGRSEQPVIAMTRVAIAAGTIHVLGNIETSTPQLVVSAKRRHAMAHRQLLRHTKNGAELRQGKRRRVPQAR